MAKVAFLGLGVMGFPMARHLATSGHEVTVYNRTESKAVDWCKANSGRRASTPAEAAHGQDAVFLCVGNDDDVRVVVLGPDGALGAMTPGAVLIDNTTASAEVAREIATATEEVGVHFVDAPVSGGQAGAENGQLTVMCGGTADAYALAEPLIAAFAKACRHMGPTGSGQLTKMVNQICIAGLVQALSEGIHFAQKSGLDVNEVIGAISQGAASSWQLMNRGSTMGEGKFDFGFAVELMRKDLGICLDEAKRNGAHLPVTQIVDQFYGEVIEMGGRRWDTSSLIVRLDRA